MHGIVEKCGHVRSQNLKGRHHLGDLGVDGKIILAWLLRK
jgi:hypothetical protein